MSSVESAAAWSEVASGWERRDAWVSAGARPVTERLLERLDPQPGWKVLEIGGGLGEVGRRVAELVGPHGHVLISDQSDGMVEAARRRSEGLANVSLQVVDAQAMPFESERYDGAVSRFSYMLMPDPAAGLAETRRVLRPGGRLAFAVWTAAAENPWGSAVGRTMVALGHAEPPAPDAPGPFRLGDPDRLRALVAGAGFSEPELDPVDIAMRYASVDEYWEVTQDLAMSLRDALARLDAAAAAELRARVRELLVPYEGPDELAIPGRAWVVSAGRP
jgi:SAM-dependent methyltransferase